MSALDTIIDVSESGRGEWQTSVSNEIGAACLNDEVFENQEEGLEKARKGIEETLQSQSDYLKFGMKWAVKLEITGNGDAEATGTLTYRERTEPFTARFDEETLMCEVVGLIETELAGVFDFGNMWWQDADDFGDSKE